MEREKAINPHEDFMSDFEVEAPNRFVGQIVLKKDRPS